MSITSFRRTPPFPVVTSAQRSVLAVAFASALVPVVAVVLRLIARRYTARSFNASDVCIIIACVLAVALQAVIIVVFDCGIGYGHTLDIILSYGMDPITLLMKLFLPFQMCWVLSLALSKASVALLYQSLFPYRAIQWTCKGFNLFIALWVSATVLIGALICQPYAMNWDPTIPGGHCGNYVLAFTITGVINLATDVFVLVLPLPYLYKLSLPRHKKAILMSVFGVGLLTCIVSAIRIEALYSLNFLNVTHTAQRAVIVSALEPSVAVTLVSVPLLQPLLRARVRPERCSPAAAQNLRQDIEGLAGNDKHRFESVSEDCSGCRLQSDGSQQNTGGQSADQPLSSLLSSRSLGSEHQSGGPSFNRSGSSTLLLSRH